MRIPLTHLFSLIALAASAGIGTMQGAQQATFHLSAPAHWGQALLMPGDYKLLTPDPSTGHAVFLVEGGGKSIYELPIVSGDAQHSFASSHLTLSEVDGSYFVHEFSSAVTGKTFIFAIPNPNHSQETARRLENSIVLSVR